MKFSSQHDICRKTVKKYTYCWLAQAVSALAFWTILQSNSGTRELSFFQEKWGRKPGSGAGLMHYKPWWSLTSAVSSGHFQATDMVRAHGSAGQAKCHLKEKVQIALNIGAPAATALIWCCAPAELPIC